MDVLERAQQIERERHANVIHLEVGEPDFDTPDCVIEAGVKAMRDAKTHYTHSLGLLELREAIIEHYAAEYGVTVSPEQVLVASGTSPAMLLLFAALLNAGDVRVGDAVLDARRSLGLDLDLDARLLCRLLQTFGCHVRVGYARRASSHAKDERLLL